MRNTPTASLLAISVALSFAAVPIAAMAQDDPAPAPAPEPEITDDEILVIAETLRGQLDAPVPPVLELNEADIAAYGAGSIADLVQALGSTVGSGGRGAGGMPVILVNGMRISSFRELRSYPPEAIDKVEVFPEEVAQRYGYSADQRVVNFVMKRDFSSREIEAEYGQPWDGGYSTQELEGTYLQLIGESRLNFNLEWNNSSVLTEAERDVIQTPGIAPGLASDPDLANYRSLVSDSADIQAEGNFATRIATGTSLSLNAAFERGDSLSYQGLDTVVLTDEGESLLRTLNESDPLTVDRRSTTYSLGSTLNTGLGDWQITATVDANRAESRSLIARRATQADLAALQDAVDAGELAIDGPLPDLPDAGFDRADTRSDTATSKVTATGMPILLPGGDIFVTVDGGYDYTNIKSEDTRNPGVETSLKRGNLNAGVNVGIPITSTREDFGAAIGDLNLNLSAGVDHLSDFGTLTDWSAGFNWRPTERLNFTVNHTRRDAAPSLGQLGDPEIATLNVPVYDLARGETVLATVISGGNPTLPAQSQSDWRIGMDWELPAFTDAIQQGRFRIEFIKNHSEDVASGFPVLTPTIEAAFPGRVLRDPDTGMITQVDQRPVTFARQDSERIQVGLNFTGPFGKARPEAAARAQANNPMAQAFGAMRGGGQGQGGGAPANGEQGPAGGPGPQGASAGQFNPQAFQQLRDRFCTPEAADTVPTAEDLAGLPEPMVQRLRNPDGTIDAERWAQMRANFCNANFQPPDPERLAALRESVCGRPGQEPPPITEEQLAALPPQMLERLKGPDGEIDPERVAQLRTRFCSADFGRPPQGGLGGPPPGGIAGPPPGGPPPGGGGRRGRGGPGFFGPPGGGSEDGRGRWFVNFNYSYEIKNEVLIAEGGPLLDLLDGGATSGSQPRHSVQFNGGMFYAGFGANMNARYTGSSRIDGSGLPGSTDLEFHDFATVNLRLFADLNQRTSLIEQVPLFKNTRITLAMNNVFDARQRVTDDTGTVPLRYQPYLMDPTGRSFSIQFRKLF